MAGDLADSVEKGRLEGLKALRSTLVGAIGVDGGKQTAAVARQLREVMREIDEIERTQGRKGSIVDELAGRRETRVSDPAGGVAAGGRGSKRRGGRG